MGIHDPLSPMDVGWHLRQPFSQKKVVLISHYGEGLRVKQSNRSQHLGEELRCSGPAEVKSNGIVVYTHIKCRQHWCSRNNGDIWVLVLMSSEARMSSGWRQTLAKRVDSMHLAFLHLAEVKDLMLLFAVGIVNRFGRNLKTYNSTGVTTMISQERSCTRAE